MHYVPFPGNARTISAHRGRRRFPLALHGIGPHPGGEALLKTAVLAAVAVVLVNRTIHVAATLVAQIFANRPLKKAFAALARDNAVMPTGGLVLRERVRERVQERVRKIKEKDYGSDSVMPVASSSTSRYLADDAKIEFPEPGQRIHVIPVEIPVGSRTHVHRMACK